MTHVPSNRIDCSGKPTTATVQVFAGGGAQALIECEQTSPFDTRIVFDAPAELAQRLADKKPEGVHFYALAEGHTVLTLSKGASEGIETCLREFPGVDLGQGLGQYRGIGELAAKQLLADDCFQLFLSDLALKLIARHGELTHVRVVGKAGLAGGTGSAGVLILTEAILQALLEKTDAVVKYELDLIGAITAEGLGRRVAKNAAAGIVDAMGRLTAKDHHERASQIGCFHELPAVGPDRVARDNFVLQFEQARTADEVREVIDRRAPNQALNGRFGNLWIERADFYQPLHQQLEVAADVARSFHAELRDLQKVRSNRCIDSLEYLEDRRILSQETIEDLVARAFESDPDELYETAKEAAFDITFQVQALLKTRTRINLSAAHTVFSIPPRDTRAAKERLATQRAALNALSAALSDLDFRRQELEQNSTRLDRRLVSAIDAIHPRSSLQRMLGAFRSEEGRLENLAEAIRADRENSDKLVELRAMLASLEAAYQEVEEEHNFLLDKLNSLIARLEPLVVRGDADRREFFVRCAPLDEYFAELWHVDNRTTEERLTRLLGRAVREVTLHGLAKIVRAEAPRLEVIASQIAKRAVVTSGPCWGGKARRDKPLSIHVLPPLASDAAARLRQLIQQEDPEALVAIADTAAAGVNCVDLHLYSVEEASDLMTGFYRQECSELNSHPQRPLYFPEHDSRREELIAQILNQSSRSNEMKGDQNGQIAH
ncbi:MAG: hypothetical protein K2Y37_27045 [Pirellulales bacterium]|nr:hypothetical protein [Pirellulales bacterium]